MLRFAAVWENATKGIEWIVCDFFVSPFSLEQCSRHCPGSRSHSSRDSCACRDASGMSFDDNESRRESHATKCCASCESKETRILFARQVLSTLPPIVSMWSHFRACKHRRWLAEPDSAETSRSRDAVAKPRFLPDHPSGHASALGPIQWKKPSILQEEQHVNDNVNFYAGGARGAVTLREHIQLHAEYTPIDRIW